MRRVVTAVAAALTFTAAVRAEDRSCFGPDLTGLQPVEVGRIRSSAARVSLVKGGAKLAQCPDASSACREKAYLVPGDLVVLGQKLGDFVCADYPGAKIVRSGWLPVDAVATATFEASPEAFAGKWRRVEAEIEISLKYGTLQAVGEATFGALDPARVKRGAVNMGNFEGALALNGGVAIYPSEPIGAKDPDPYRCKVRLTRAGEMLIVQDNNQCGGANVTFIGYYFRAKR
jgi:hypothetical protein